MELVGLCVVHPIAPLLRDPASAAEQSRQHAESHGRPDGKKNHASDAQCSQHKNLKIRLLPFYCARKIVASIWKQIGGPKRVSGHPGFFAYGANPAFFAFLDYLNV